jgi:cytochrome c553
MASSGRRHPLPGDGERRAPVWRKAFTVAAVAVAASMMATADGARAEDATAGRQKALQCQACHGLDGRAKIPGAPHIDGQVKEYLAKAMHDYKSGARKDEVMAVVVRQLSDQDIEDLAAYYAGLGAEAKGER